MNRLFRAGHPLAITMWDFSWLERRWPGAGYEDWAEALDQLVERGYDAVRIDAYPHLLAADPAGLWEILPPWDQSHWGAQARVDVQVWPALPEFIRLCAARGVQVALSTWFQDDTTHQRELIPNAAAHAGIWLRTLELLEKENLVDHILYVDLCNEWPFPHWAPFFHRPAGAAPGDWRIPASLAWMRESVELVRTRYPDLPLTYSFSDCLDDVGSHQIDVGFLDFLEPHCWMASMTEFYARVDYNFERFDPKGYRNVADRAERLYRSDPDHWKAGLAAIIDRRAAWSLKQNKPLVTTEGWSIVDYKDGPRLPWGWVMELNAWAVERVVASGRWAAVCTSNFAGPQFHGMWRDVAWHQRLTRLIKSAPLPKPAGGVLHPERAGGTKPVGV